LLPRPITAEQILQEAKADGERLRDQPVVHHREWAQRWQRHTRSWYALLVTIVAVALLINSRWLTAFYVLLAFWIGGQWRVTKARQQEALTKAWAAENEETINAMAQGGLVASPREVLEVMRDADPPPGVSRKAWREQHDEMIKEWDERHS
jgi:hypothetical protein